MPPKVHRAVQAPCPTRRRHPQVHRANPQIVRVSAIRPCIAQAAPELLNSPHLKVPASHPWPRGTDIPVSAAQSSSRCSSALPYPARCHPRVYRANPQIVRVSAIHPCIAQAAPELLRSPHRKVPASRPWPRGTDIPVSAAQSSSRCSSALPYPARCHPRVYRANPQIVRVSAIHPCIAQAAPELLRSPHRKVPASRPWPRGTDIPVSAAQSSSHSSGIDLTQSLLSLQHPCSPSSGFLPSSGVRFARLFDVHHLPRPPKPHCCRWSVHWLSKRVIPAHRPLSP
ncbi:MAG: hypothetical protein PHD43_02615 [Methylococcales bacterium]|nr:hypothetical protein [Methylococcales bacterium]